MRYTSKMLLAFLAFLGIFNPIYLGLYAAFSCTVLANVYFRRRAVSKTEQLHIQLMPRFIGTGARLRKTSIEKGKAKVKLSSVFPSKKMVAGFAAVAVVALLAGVVIGATLVQYRFNGSGRIVIPPSLGVYSDQACTVEVSAIDFGSFAPGENVTRTLFVRNEGSEPGVLSLATQNWNPTTAKEYLVFSWNLEGAEIEGDAVFESQFNIRALSTLTNNSGISNFSFDALISLTIDSEAS